MFGYKEKALVQAFKNMLHTYVHIYHIFTYNFLNTHDMIYLNNNKFLFPGTLS